MFHVKHWRPDAKATGSQPVPRAGRPCRPARWPHLLPSLRPKDAREGPDTDQAQRQPHPRTPSEPLPESPRALLESPRLTRSPPAVALLTLEEPPPLLQRLPYPWPGPRSEKGSPVARSRGLPASPSTPGPQFPGEHVRGSRLALNRAWSPPIQATEPEQRPTRGSPTQHQPQAKTPSRAPTP